MKKILLLALLSMMIGCKNYTTRHLVKTEKGIYRFYSERANSHVVEAEFCKSDKNLDNVENCKPVTVQYGF